MIEVSEPQRVLKYNGHVLADLNPSLPIEHVLRMHASAGVFPELSTATLEGPSIEDGRAVYTAVTRLGTKG